MPVKLIAVLAAAALGVCLALLVFTMKGAGESSQPPIVAQSTDAPNPAPDTAKPVFVASEGHPPPPPDAFLDASGKEVRLADFKGRSVLVNLWATWCAPCVKELPSLARLKAAQGDALVVVAINLDNANATETADYLKGIDAAALDPFTDPTKKLMRSFRIVNLPTTVLIGPDGQEIARHEGDVAWDSPEAQAAIAKAVQR